MCEFLSNNSTVVLPIQFFLDNESQLLQHLHALLGRMVLDPFRHPKAATGQIVENQQTRGNRHRFPAHTAIRHIRRAFAQYARHICSVSAPDAIQPQFWGRQIRNQSPKLRAVEVVGGADDFCP